jgi:peptidylprolyl isomerase
VWQDRGEEGPQLLFSPPLGVTGPVARVVDEGTGPVIVEGDSVTFDYAMFAGNTGELAYSTYGTDEEQTISVQSQGMSQTFAEALIGKQVGAHVIFATIDSSQTTMAETLVTMFMAVTVTDSHAVPARAEGEPVVPDAGLPAVSLAENGAPSIEFVADSVAPHELVSQELIRGSGPAVTPGQTITIKFTAWLWDGAEFDSTWQDNASMTWPLSDGQSMPGLIEGLSGKAVGSQVLLIIPPSLGFGELEMEGIPPNSTLVYVIDILDAR